MRMRNTFMGLLSASWMSTRLRIMVWSNLRSNANRSIYACDSEQAHESEKGIQ